MSYLSMLQDCETKVLLTNACMCICVLNFILNKQNNGMKEHVKISHFLKTEWINLTNDTYLILFNIYNLQALANFWQ
jgi:hypothetical protein